MRIRIAAAVILCAALAGCGGDPATDTSAPAAPASSSVPSATYKPGAVGQPFPWRAWQITVSGMRCGEAAAVMSGSDGGDHRADVCTVQFRYTNTGTEAQQMTGNDLELAAYDQQGRRFDGFTWARGQTNPGTSDDNEMVFDVPDGLTLAAVVVGDVRVPLGVTAVGARHPPDDERDGARSTQP